MAIGSFALMLMASLSVAAPAAAHQVRVRVQVADSLVILRGELQRVTLNQQALARELRLASTRLRRSSDAERAVVRARLEELTARFERSLNDLEILRAHVREKCAEQPEPDGWLGVSLDMTATATATSFVVRRYPVVISVEPGSPAQRAGLASGDEIVALAGRDMVSGEVEIAALLKPGLQLPVRYRRDGELRTLNVLVEPRPEGFLSNCPWIEISPAPAVAAGPRRMRIFELPNGGFGYAFSDSTGPRVIERAPPVRGTPVLPPTPYAPAPFRLQAMVPGPNVAVAGAILMPLTEGLREGLGLDDGILVLDVLGGSPALEAGLREGDVITRVNGQKLRSIVGLISALDAAREREVELQVSRRNAKPRTVRLRQ